MSSRSRLKEQDPLIEWVLADIRQGQGSIEENTRGTITKLDTHLEDLYHATKARNDAKRHDDEKSASQKDQNNYAPIQKEIPVDPVHLKLNVRQALEEYNEKTRICQRRFVVPTFREIRHILNVATVNAISSSVRLVTMDADDTIYEDGGVVTLSSPMIGLITRLLREGVFVALVTAAGYPDQPRKYEERLRGLLDAFQMSIDMGASSESLNRFLVMGGECNYLHQLTIHDDTVRLKPIKGELWKNGRGVRWKKTAIDKLLSKAEQTLRDAAERLDLEVSIIRKDRAVGLVRKTDQRFSYEVLEEVALTAQQALKDSPVPHCAFNGGNDVWVDVGNKALGIQALQAFLSPAIDPSETIHVGDRFTRTGNDTRARDVANSLWVSNPSETQYFIRHLLQKIEAQRKATAPSDVKAEVPNPDDEGLEYDSAGTFSDDDTPYGENLSEDESGLVIRVPRRVSSVSKLKRNREWGMWDAAGGVVVGKRRATSDHAK